METLNSHETIKDQTMEHSMFITRLPLVFRVVSFIDIHTGICNCLVVVFQLGATLLIACFAFWSLLDTNSNYRFENSHDLLIFFILFTSEVVLIRNKMVVSSLVRELLEPLPVFGKNTQHEKAVEDFVRKTHKCGITVWSIFLISVFWALSPLLALFYNPQDIVSSSFPYFLIWIPNSVQSYSQMVVAYVLAVGVIIFGLAHFFCWYPVMIYGVLKIELEVRLLALDLPLVQEKVNQDIDQRRRDFMMVWRNHVHWDQIRQFSFTRHLNDLVERHLHIIKCVHLLEDSFCLPVLIYNQFAILAVIFGIPKIRNIGHLSTTDIVIKSFELIGVLSCTAIFNYCGQVVFNESETLRQAVYGTNWTSWPQEIKRNFMIIQAVATKFMRLTSGGIQTLSMEGLTKTLSAAYSYASVLQSVKN